MNRRPEVVPAIYTPAQVRMERAVMEAMKGLANWSFTRVVGQPEAGDADCLKHDLIAAAEIFDDFIKAFGDYAHSTIGLNKNDLDCFHDQLRNAIDGNALHVLDKAAGYLRDLRSGSEGQRHDSRRGLLEAAE